jgi:hypothetical protein
MAGHLNANHSKLIQAALELIKVLFAAPWRKAGGPIKTAAGTLAHICRVVIHGLASLKTQPLLPNRYPKDSLVDAGVVHRLDLCIKGIVAFNPLGFSRMICFFPDSSVPRDATSPNPLGAELRKPFNIFSFVNRSSGRWCILMSMIIASSSWTYSFILRVLRVLSGLTAFHMVHLPK